MKLKKKKSRKISEMLLKVGAGFIQMGTTREERENCLRSVCTAWNIACLPESHREKCIFETVVNFKNINNSTKEEVKYYEEDMRKLIEVKLSLYPNVKSQVLSTEITEENGKDKVVAISKKM